MSSIILPQDKREGLCPGCGEKGPIGAGCKTCPGFWFTRDMWRLTGEDPDDLPSEISRVADQYPDLPTSVARRIACGRLEKDK